MGFWPLAFVGIVLIDRRHRRTPGAAAGSCGGGGRRRPAGADVVVDARPDAAGLGARVGAARRPCSGPRWRRRRRAPGGGWRCRGPGSSFEAVRGRWPFGGVPLSNLAVGQVDGAARRGGAGRRVACSSAASSSSVAVALAAAVRRRWARRRHRGRRRCRRLAVAAVAPDGDGTGETIDVALVQGGGAQGTHAVDTDDREVFERHLAASEDVARRSTSCCGPRTSSTSTAPSPRCRRARELADAVARGSATRRSSPGSIQQSGDRFTNQAIAFVDGEIVDAVGKERRVPFGEFVPFRSLDRAVRAGHAVGARRHRRRRASPSSTRPSGRSASSSAGRCSSPTAPAMRSATAARCC